MDDVSWERWWRLQGRQQLTELLWEKWDPIGWPASETSRGFKPPRDEYQSYAGPIATMLRAGKSADEIARYLEDVEANRMGLRNPDDQRPVALELIAWYERAVADASS